MKLGDHTEYVWKRFVDLLIQLWQLQLGKLLEGLTFYSDLLLLLSYWFFRFPEVGFILKLLTSNMDRNADRIETCLVEILRKRFGVHRKQVLHLKSSHCE